MKFSSGAQMLPFFDVRNWETSTDVAPIQIVRGIDATPLQLCAEFFTNVLECLNSALWINL